MKTPAYLFFCLAISATIFFSCNEDNSPVHTETPVPEPNKLCDGNGSAYWLPLEATYNWQYNSSGTGTYTFTYMGTEEVQGTTYHRVDEKYYTGGSLNATVERYYRYDQSNSLVTLDKIGGSFAPYERIVIPASPMTGQSWADPNNGNITFKLNSMQAVVTTNSCTYTGLYEIITYNGSNEVSREYYKRGLGIVQRILNLTPVVTLSLVSVNI